MGSLGFDVVLVRDLTDAMYGLRDEPYGSHEKGTRPVIAHIEKHWAPTVLANDLMQVRFPPT